MREKLDFLIDVNKMASPTSSAAKENRCEPSESNKGSSVGAGPLTVVTSTAGAGPPTAGPSVPPPSTAAPFTGAGSSAGAGPVGPATTSGAGSGASIITTPTLPTASLLPLSCATSESSALSQPTHLAKTPLLSAQIVPDNSIWSLIEKLPFMNHFSMCYLTKRIYREYQPSRRAFHEFVAAYGSGLGHERRGAFGYSTDATTSALQSVTTPSPSPVGTPATPSSKLLIASNILNDAAGSTATSVLGGGATTTVLGTANTSAAASASSNAKNASGPTNPQEHHGCSADKKEEEYPLDAIEMFGYLELQFFLIMHIRKFPAKKHIYSRMIGQLPWREENTRELEDAGLDIHSTTMATLFSPTYLKTVREIADENCADRCADENCSGNASDSSLLVTAKKVNNSGDSPRMSGGVNNSAVFADKLKPRPVPTAPGPVIMTGVYAFSKGLLIHRDSVDGNGRKILTENAPINERTGYHECKVEHFTVIKDIPYSKHCNSLDNPVVYPQNTSLLTSSTAGNTVVGAAANSCLLTSVVTGTTAASSSSSAVVTKVLGAENSKMVGNTTVLPSTPRVGGGAGSVAAFSHKKSVGGSVGANKNTTSPRDGKNEENRSEKKPNQSNTALQKQATLLGQQKRTGGQNTSTSKKEGDSTSKKEVSSPAVSSIVISTSCVNF